MVRKTALVLVGGENKSTSGLVPHSFEQLQMIRPLTFLRPFAFRCEVASSLDSTYLNAGGQCARPDVEANTLSVIVK